MNEKNESEILNSFLDAFLPPPIYTVSEWADNHRTLSTKASSEPGRWRTSRTPYLKAIMDDLSDYSPFQEVVFKKAAQIGATEAGNNWIGYTIDHAPAPMLAVLPNLETAKRSSRQRIAPLIEETETLRSRVNVKKQKDSDNTILQKDFPGGTLILAGANSPAGLRSMPAKKLFLDEIDAYPIDCGGEGDPVQLAEARARTFGSKKKIFKCSTPTVEGHSRISSAFELTDKKFYYVPCPKCRHFQKLEFKQLKWNRGDISSVKYQCIKCDHLIEEYHKTKMLDAGKWIAENPAASNSLVSGYHLNSLYSPLGWFSWSEIAQEWDDIQKKGDKNLLKAFMNTVLGETFKEQTEVPDFRRLYRRREQYKIGKCPKGVVFVTCGIDVQKDRFECHIVGWGRNHESWSIDYIVIPGDTSDDQVWKKLDELVNMTFPMEANERISLPIKLTAIDSGYNTQTVYNWVRKYPQTKVIAIKGSDTLSLSLGLPKPVDINLKGRKIKRGAQCWPVGVSMLKQELYSWLKHEEPIEDQDYPSGYCHFPEFGIDFFEQLTAEEMQTKIIKGFKKIEWVKIRERNEVLDTRIYARAAAIACGSDRWTEEKWQKMEAQFVASSIPEKRSEKLAESIESVVPIKKPKIRRQKRESSWL